MNWSQENCLIDNHRLTCERWGWGFIDTWCMRWLVCYIRQMQSFYSGDNQLFSYAGRAFLIALVLHCRKVFLPGNAWGEEVLIHFIQFYKIAVTMVCRGIAQRLRLWKVGAFSFQPLLAAWIIQADSFIIHSLWKGSRYHAGCVSHKTLPIW